MAFEKVEGSQDLEQDKERGCVRFKGRIAERQDGARFMVRHRGFSSVPNPVPCFLSGKLRMRAPKLTPGTWVYVEISVYDRTRGRITDLVTDLDEISYGELADLLTYDDLKEVK